MVPFQKVITAVQVQKNYQDPDVNLHRIRITGLQGRLSEKHSVINQTPLVVKTGELLPIWTEKMSEIFEGCQSEGDRASAEGLRMRLLPLRQQ